MMNGLCGFYGLHDTLHGVWRKQLSDFWHGWVLGIAPLCKCCFSGGYFGDCMFLERIPWRLKILLLLRCGKEWNQW